MPLFSYTARDPIGRQVNGTVDAASTQAARAAIQDRGLLPEEIHEATLQERQAQNLESAPAWESTDTAPAAFAVPTNDAPPSGISEAQEERDASSDASSENSDASEVAVNRVYFPLSRTLALYAGWLLAYYCLVYAVGWYQYSRALPFEIPYIQALLLSPLVLWFSLAAFLFLLLSHLHRMMRGGILRGILLGLLGIAAFALYQMNVA